MIVIVTQKNIENAIGRRYMISTDRAVIHVTSAEEALEIIAERPSEAAPMVTFVPDEEQLSDLLTRMEGWPEINVVVIVGSFRTNAKTLATYFGDNRTNLT